MRYCRNCNLYIYGHHECPPKWEVCDPSYDQDYWLETYANDAEEAAANFCEHMDVSSADYTYLRDGGADEILVRKSGESEAIKVAVTAESRPTYSGRLA